jgi:predicted secreted protein
MATNNPAFICIGAQKAGTTWLYVNLKSHPDIHLTPLKELHYFDELYKKEKTRLIDRITAKEGMNKWMWQNNLVSSFKKAIAKHSINEFLWCTRYFFLRRNFDWYKKLFNFSSGKISGDITPDYCILDKETIRLIKENLPHLKIFYIIRNPVDRAWSALKMRYVKRRNHNIDDIGLSMVNEYYELFHEFNDFARTITNWTTFFHDDQFKIFFYDELSEKPDVFYKKILNYLGVYAVETKTVDRKSDMLNKKVHEGIKADMPLKIKKILCHKNYEQLVYLNNYFQKSGEVYPQKWLKDAEETLKI